MRFLVGTLLTIGLAAMLSGCGGSSKQEETTPAASEAAPAEESAPAEGEGEGGQEGEGEAEAPKEEPAGGW